MRFPKFETTTCCLRQHASLCIQLHPFAFKITYFPIKLYVEKCLRDAKMKFQHCFRR